MLAWVDTAPSRKYNTINTFNNYPTFMVGIYHDSAAWFSPCYAHWVCVFLSPRIPRPLSPLQAVLDVVVGWQRVGNMFAS